MADSGPTTECGRARRIVAASSFSKPSIFSPDFLVRFTDPPVAGFAGSTSLSTPHRTTAFNAASLPSIKDGQATLHDAIDKTTSSTELFGTRQFLGADWVMRRATGAAMAIDVAKQPLDGSKNYVLHFTGDQVAPVKFFHVRPSSAAPRSEVDIR